MRWVKSNLNIVHLRTLQAVVQLGSHSAAAKHLGYTTSAVSQQVAALEKAVGVELFERGPRNLWPTPAGSAMEEHAYAILKLVAHAEDDMRNFASGASGALRISASGTAAAQLIPRALAKLAVQFSDADISVEDNGDLRRLTDDVLEGFADLVILYEYDFVPLSRPDGLVFHTVLDEELVVVTGTDSGAAKFRQTVADLSSEQWVTNEVGSAGTENFYQVCMQEGFEPQVRYYSNDFDVIRGIVKEHLGVALIPALALGIDRSIKMHRIPLATPRRKVLVAHRSSDTNILLPATLKALQDAAAEFLAWASTAFIEPQETPLGVIPAEAENVVGRRRTL